MIRALILSICLLMPLHATAAEPSGQVGPSVTTPPGIEGIDEENLPASAPPALPSMRFISSIIADDLLQELKQAPALATLETELPGSPLALIVTHTIRPTAGGQAAGLLSAVLAGGTLGLIPVVSNERLVLRYEVMLNGKAIVRYDFERTATRAQNMWATGNDGQGGLGKAGAEWVRSTAAEVAARLPADPAMLAVRDEIGFYFPEMLAGTGRGNP